MSVILLNPHFSPSHENKVSVTLTSLWMPAPCPCRALVSRSCHQFPKLPLGIQVGWLLATEWEVLKANRLSANAVSALFPTCYNDALHFSLFVKMSLNF